MNDNTPAASGAAPAEDFEAWLDEFDDPQFPELRRRDRFGERVIEDFRIGWDAALASREASSATLTDERIVELWVEHGLDELDPEAFARVIEREVRAALASPQVAPDPTFEAAFMDMPGMSSVRQHELWAEADPGHVEGRDPEGEMCWRLATFARLMVKGLATPVQVAPQDDARDAAEALTDEQIIKAVSPHLIFDDGPYGDNSTNDVLNAARALLAISTPAAKPTEPALPTQGEQSHD